MSNDYDYERQARFHASLERYAEQLDRFGSAEEQQMLARGKAKTEERIKLSPLQETGYKLTELVKVHIGAMIGQLKDEEGKPRSPELQRAITCLHQAALWIDDHERKNGKE